MHEVFDDFHLVKTWYTHHQSDEERFFAALKNVVNHEDFNPDQMGQYITEHAEHSLDEGAISDSVDYYVAAAWPVKKYLANQS